MNNLPKVAVPHEASENSVGLEFLDHGLPSTNFFKAGACLNFWILLADLLSLALDGFEFGLTGQGFEFGEQLAG